VTKCNTCTRDKLQHLHASQTVTLAIKVDFCSRARHELLHPEQFYMLFGAALISSGRSMIYQVQWCCCCCCCCCLLLLLLAAAAHPPPFRSATGASSSPGIGHVTRAQIRGGSARWGVVVAEACVTCCMSRVDCHTSHVTRHTSHVTRHTTHVTRHTSHVTRHTSHVTRHTSHVTRHTSQDGFPAWTSTMRILRDYDRHSLQRQVMMT